VIKPTLIIAVLMASGVIAIACGGSAIQTPGPSPTPAMHDIAVTLTLTDDVNGVGGERDECFGVGAFSDIKRGAQVTVKDAQGTILAFGRLADSVGISAFASQFGDAAPLTSCKFTTAVAGVPEVPIYAVNVGSRDAINYTLQDLRAANWSLQLSTGVTR
jgi:hypothetical protein